MNKKIKIRIGEILLLLAVVALYSWFVWRYLAMLPAAGDPLEYVEPSVWKTLVGYFPLIDRLAVVDGIRLLSVIFRRQEIAGAVYFAGVNFAILAAALSWSYLKRGFWTAFLVGIMFVSSYPLLRYANYGYPDATVALYGLLALLAYLSKKSVFWVGALAALAVFSKITGLGIALFFLVDLALSRRWSELKIYILGFIAAGGAIFLLTGLLFDFASLKYVLQRVSQNIAVNTEPRSVGKSLLTVLRPEVILPLLLASVIFWKKARQDEMVRKIFLLAFSFLGFFILLVVASSHVCIYPHYLYPTFIFSLLGAAFTFGNIGSARQDSLFFRLSVIALLILVSVSSMIGLLAAHYFRFSSLSQLAALPWWLLTLYGLLPLVILGLILIVQKFQTKGAVAIFMLVVTLLGGFFSSATAYANVEMQKNETTAFYHYGEAMTAATSPFTLYEPSETIARQQQIYWIYLLFYKKDPHFSSLNRLETVNTLKFLKKGEISSQKGLIITEDPATVQSLSPNAKIVRQFKWPTGQVAILEI